MNKPLLLAGLALSFAFAVPVALSQEKSAMVGSPAPAIHVTDWINGDGRQSLEDFRGDVVVLEFWKTH
jgi:hypothetical protein